MNVGKACSRKPVIAGRDIDIIEAAGLMRKHHVGTLIIIDEHDGVSTPVGIITDRDLVVEVLPRDMDLHRIRLEEVMTGSPLTAGEADDLYETLEKMWLKGVRRVPVVDHRNNLIGVLSTDDVLEVLARELSGVIKLFERERGSEEMFRI